MCPWPDLQEEEHDHLGLVRGSASDNDGAAAVLKGDGALRDAHADRRLRAQVAVPGEGRDGKKRKKKKEQKVSDSRRWHFLLILVLRLLFLLVLLVPSPLPLLNK